MASSWKKSTSGRSAKSIDAAAAPNAGWRISGQGGNLANAPWEVHAADSRFLGLAFATCP
jgi:hypothetical protein